MGNVYIFSSYCEVFGLTSLEAMKNKTPVLISKCSAIPEINGKAALYFNPKNHKDIGKEISGVKLTGNINNLISNSQVIIDFSVPKATLSLVRALKYNNEVCLITGTTGFSEIQLKEFKKLSKGLRIMQSYNMSIGVNLLLSSVEFFSEKLGKGVDIEIIETHHKYKKDAPSGTALSIGEAVKRGRNSYEKNKFVNFGMYGKDGSTTHQIFKEK